MSPFARQFMTGPLLKAKKHTAPWRCARCGTTKPGKVFIHPPYDVCQACVAIQDVAERLERQREASRKVRSAD